MKVELPKSMILMPDLLDSLSKMFSGFKSQWMIWNIFRYFSAYSSWIAKRRIRLWSNP